MDRDAILKLAARHAHVVSSTGNAAGCVPNYLTFRPDGILSFVQALAAATAAQPQPIEVTDAMVAAYLQANDAYWKRTDELPTPPNKWRTGTPSEATRESLKAALAATTAAQPQPRDVLQQALGALETAIQALERTESQIGSTPSEGEALRKAHLAVPALRDALGGPAAGATGEQCWACPDCHIPEGCVIGQCTIGCKPPAKEAAATAAQPAGPEDMAVYAAIAQNYAATAAQPAQPAQPVDWKWRRHARATWEYGGRWDEIEEMAAAEMEAKGWDVVRLYPGPATGATGAAE